MNGWRSAIGRLSIASRATMAKSISVLRHTEMKRSAKVSLPAGTRIWVIAAHDRGQRTEHKSVLPIRTPVESPQVPMHSKSARDRRAYRQARSTTDDAGVRLPSKVPIRLRPGLG